MEEYKRLFTEEVEGILTDIELLVSQLRENPNNIDLVGILKDSFRRIKKNMSMFGFDHNASFAHDMEVVFDKVLNGIVPLNPKLMGLIISARDNIWENVRSYDDTLDNDTIWISLELQALSGNFSLSKARETIWRSDNTCRKRIA